MLPLSWSVGPLTITPSAQWVWVDDPAGYNPEELTGESPKDVLFVGPPSASPSPSDRPAVRAHPRRRGAPGSPKEPNDRDDL